MSHSQELEAYLRRTAWHLVPASITHTHTPPLLGNVLVWCGVFLECGEEEFIIWVGQGVCVCVHVCARVHVSALNSDLLR